MQVLQLNQFLPYRLNRISSRLSELGSLIYKDNFDLTVPEWRTLVTVGEFGQASAKQICRDTAMDKTKVSRAVRSLEQKNWLRRNDDPNDRRVEILTLTRVGKNILMELCPRMLEFEDSVLDKLSHDDRQKLLTAIDTLEQILDLSSDHRPDAVKETQL